MAKTINEIKSEAMKVLAEVPGIGVNTYSDDRMFGDVVRTFNLMFKKFDWPHLMDWFRAQIDPATGVVVGAETFKFVIDQEDFRGVFRDGTETRLPRLSGQNPYAIPSGQLRYWDYLPATHAQYSRKLRFWPLGVSDYVNVAAKVYPKAANWAGGDTIPLDFDLMVAGTAFLTLCADDINPSAADAQRNIMEMRYKDIVANFSNEPILIKQYHRGIPGNWFQAP